MGSSRMKQGEASQKAEYGGPGFQLRLPEEP